MTMYRQGDVLLRKLDTTPKGRAVSQEPKVILAYGETTGHHHRFENPSVVAFFKEGDAEIGAQPIAGGSKAIGEPTQIAAVTIPEGGADLIHEEHDAIHVEPGHYEVIRQREYVPPAVKSAKATTRTVVD